MIEHDPGVRTSMAFSEMKQPLLAATTRWNYLSQHLIVWKEHVRFRLYAMILGALGIYFLVTQPLLAVISLGFATYFYQKHQHCVDRTLKSQRTVIIGH